MSRQPYWNAGLGLLLFSALVAGCARHQQRPSITAVGLSPSNMCDPPGIPYYLPKPLLVVAKNVRHIDESKVGLTAPVPIPGGFDNQAAYGDIKANVTVPGHAAAADTGDTTTTNTITNEASAPTQSMVAESMTPDQRIEDGIAPDSFFTYQVIFVPDLTQKYGLQITGGAGEFRAAMNLVNGWMYTGTGPFYFKDSSTAQNVMATGVAAMFTGRGAADVLNEVGELASAIGGMPAPKPEGGEYGDVQELAKAFESFARAAEFAPKVPREILNYAEVYIYEPMVLDDGYTEWKLVAEHHFDRHYFDDASTPEVAAAKMKIVEAMVSGVTKAMAPEASPTKVDSPAKAAGASKKRTDEKDEGGDIGTDEGIEELLPPAPSVPRMPVPSDMIKNGLPGQFRNSIPSVLQVPSGDQATAPVQITINDTPEPEVREHHKLGHKLKDLFHKRPSITNKSISSEQVGIIPN